MFCTVDLKRFVTGGALLIGMLVGLSGLDGSSQVTQLSSGVNVQSAPGALMCAQGFMPPPDLTGVCGSATPTSNTK